MIDKLGREINYLRISVTDRCNLRCRYCMPEEGVSLKKHREILSLEDIEYLVGIGSQLGIKKIRITGGEPLIRRNVTDLVSCLARNELIDDIAITTNGLLFSDMAADLKKAGLHRVNISLDTLKADRFRFITRGGDVGLALKGIKKALDEGFHPVKVNTVVIRGFNEDEILDFCRLACEQSVHVRFIEFMPVGEIKYWQRERLVSCHEIRTVIEKRYSLQPGKVSRGNGPAKYFQIEGGKGSVGFISPMSNHFCHECNRLRLTADGRLRACLYNVQETNLKQALEKGLSEDEIKNLFIEVIKNKPERHSMCDRAWGHKDRKMFEIGG